MASIASTVYADAVTMNNIGDCATKMAVCATNVSEAANEIIERSTEVLEKLDNFKNDADLIDKVAKVRDCMTGIKDVAEKFLKSCVALNGSWDACQANIGHLFESDKRNKVDVDKCVELLIEMHSNGVECCSASVEFDEQVASAALTCMIVKKECERIAKEKQTNESTTKVVGYVATAALGIAAILAGFLTVGTGGIAAPIAAGLLTAAAIGTGVGTKLMSDKYHEDVAKLKESVANLTDIMNLMEGTNDQLKGFKTPSQGWEKNVEIALRKELAAQRGFKEMEVELIATREEGDKKDQRIRELEAQMRDLQGK